jgi:alpha-tubulin suppressor-like RCC1 family protein
LGASKKQPATSKQKETLNQSTTNPHAKYSKQTMSKLIKKEEDPKGGQVLFTGNSNWSLTGRGDTSARFDGVNTLQLLGFQKVGALLNIKITKIISGPQASHCMAIAANGDLYVWGRNEEYQLGLKDTRNRYNPTLLPLEDGKRAAGGACGHSHSLVYTTIGEVYAMGADRAGQCGQGRRNNGGVKSPSQLNTLGTVVDVSCGKEFSVAVTAAGKMYSWGSPENGQLGNGTEGESWLVLMKASVFLLVRHHIVL